LCLLPKNQKVSILGFANLSIYSKKTTINNITIRGYVMEASGAQEVQERNFSEVHGK